MYSKKLNEVKESNSLSSVESVQTYEKLIGFYLASTEILSISSGAEGVRMLIMSNRIQGDLKEFPDRSEPLNLIIREFVDFPVEHELRGFVWKRKLTALSQYNNIAFLPSLVQKKDEIETKVKAFMDNFIGIIGDRVENFVVDIVLETTRAK